MSEDITTKSHVYLSARRKLEHRWAEITVTDVATIIGVTEDTIRRHAQDGRYGANRDRSNQPYRFDVNEVRREIGLPPLADTIG
jgi:hypothetical protein